MSNQNPLIGENAQATLNQMVDSLQFQITSISAIIKAKTANDDDNQTCCTVSDLAGLRTTLQSVKQAAEACFEQS
jgi:hypothetical protein